MFLGAQKFYDIVCRINENVIELTPCKKLNELHTDSA